MGHLVQKDAEPIPGYRLVDRLGRGGYGEVWKVIAPGGIHKALKFVHGDMEGIGSAGQAAEQEYKSLNRVKSIRHPFILSIERFDIIDGQLMIVMELADKNLFDHYHHYTLEGHRGIPREELLGFMLEAAEALDFLNFQYQIQHLDIKPQNLFLVHNHIKVGDFGLAKDMEGSKALMTGGVTPTYAPPETYDGWFSRATDQYSLAIVYQEMLTGQRPFNANNTKQLVMQHMNSPPDLSSLSVIDRRIVGRALAKDPAQRYASCLDFVRALKEGKVGSTPDQPKTEVVVRRGEEKATVVGETTIVALSPAPKILPPLVRPANVKPVVALRTPGVAARRSIDTQLAPPTVDIKLEMGEGSLFPVLFIALGATGFEVIKRVRKTTRQQNDGDNIPFQRYLYIDTDHQAIEELLSQREWQKEETVAAKLNRPSYYVNHERIPAVDAWLSTESLYAIPKTQKAEGNRLMGRLALLDYYPTIVSRVQESLNHLSNEGKRAKLEKYNALGFRSNSPKVYIIGSLMGGSGSGMIVDLAYLVRRELRRAGYDDNQVYGVFTAATEDQMPKSSLAANNVRAALSELSYFDENPYHVELSKKDGRYADQERPYFRYSLLAHRSHSNSIETAAQLLMIDTFSPLNRVLWPQGVGKPQLAAARANMQRVRFPQREVVEVMTDRFARNLLGKWLNVNQSMSDQTVSEAVSRFWDATNLSVEMLTERLQRELVKKLSDPLEKGRQAIAKLNGYDQQRLMPIDLACQVFDELLIWIGRPGVDEQDCPGQFEPTLVEIAKAIAAEYEPLLAKGVVSILDKPGNRIAKAERLLFSFSVEFDQFITKHEELEQLLEREVIQGYRSIMLTVGQLKETQAKAVRRQATSSLVGLLMIWIQKRFRFMVNRAALSIMRYLQSTIPDLAREIQSCRAVAQQMHDAISIVDCQVDTACVTTVYPDGIHSIREYCEQLEQVLTYSHYDTFDRRLQVAIVSHCGSMVSVLTKPNRYEAMFIDVLLKLSREIIKGLLGSHRVNQLLLENGSKRVISELNKKVSFTAINQEDQLRPTVLVAAIPKDEDSEQLKAAMGAALPKATIVELEHLDEVIVFSELRAIDPLRLPYFERSEDGMIITPTDTYNRFDIAWTN